MPNLMKDLMEYESLRLRPGSSSVATAYGLDKDYMSNADNAKEINKLMIKHKISMVKRFLWSLLDKLFWNLCLLFLLACALLLVYNVMGMTFLEPYFDAISKAVVNEIAQL